MNVTKNKHFFKYLLLFILIVGIFSLSIFHQNTIFDVDTSSSNGLSNKKIGWGIKRNDNHEQPDVGSENKKILENNNGICLGNKDKKYIYLTFDEGYEAGYTNKILETLKNNQVKAAFFITAHYINSQPDIVKQMIDEGHIVGNHTPKSLMSDNLKLEKV